MQRVQVRHAAANHGSAGCLSGPMPLKIRERLHTTKQYASRLRGASTLPECAPLLWPNLGVM
jgi:hypothetical protein